MSYFINNQQKVNDLIFANRNKNYGAYVLRADYGYTLLGSLFFTAILVGSICSSVYYFSNRADNNKPENGGQVLKNEHVYIIPYQHKDLSDLSRNTQKTPALKPNPNIPKTLSNALVIRDSVPENAKRETLPNELTINQTKSLTGGAINTMGSGNDTAGQGNVIGITDEKKIKRDVEVDSPPVFEGGMAALYSFIGSNLHYPSEAISEGRGGTVYVNFVVNESGYIEQISLLNKKGFGLDEEALRVVKLLPKFKAPAKIKGEAVKVYFQLPIKFVLN
jgi:protein TonB